MLSTPEIPRGVARLAWRRGADGAIAYEIAGPGPEPVRGNAGMVAVALLADGERTLADVYDALGAVGLNVGDPAQIVMVFRQLEQAGIARMRWHYETLGAVRHRCVGCGQSCEGHLVGPLSGAEVERLQEMKAVLDTEGVGLAAGDAIMTLADEDGAGDGPLRPYLRVVDGRCVFLRPDKRCAIHGRFGGDKKPLHCRLFPLRFIETEDGVRVGVSPRCARAHESFESAADEAPADWVRANQLRRPPGELVGLDPSRPRSLAYTRVYAAQAELEAYYLAVAEQSETFGAVLARAGGDGGAEGPPPAAYLASARQRLRRFGSRFEPSPLNLPGTGYGDENRELRARLDALEAEATAWTEPAPVVARYLREVLAQFVFLRHTTAFPNAEVGVHTLLVGLLGALWAGDGELERVGAYATHWVRMINVEKSERFLFDGPEDFQRFVAPLRAPHA